MQYHPDKNQNGTAEQLEEATKKFKEIQAAYEVLSDENEKAWYDSHRESILRGAYGPNGAGGGDSDEGNVADDSTYIPNLWPFFSASAYSGFDDKSDEKERKSFYAVYCDLFQAIWKSEVNGPADESADKLPKSFTPPSFGTSTSTKEEVDAFYRFWESFRTRLSFSWREVYRAQDGEDRYARRYLSKQNKSYRDAGRKEYGSTVRNLVQFIKKRDKRVLFFAEERAATLAAREAEKQLEAKRKQEEYAQKRSEAKSEQMRVLQEEAEIAEKMGAFRLADESEDESSGFGGGRKKGSRRKKGKGRASASKNDDSDDNDGDEMNQAKERFDESAKANGKEKEEEVNLATSAKVEENEKQRVEIELDNFDEMEEEEEDNDDSDAWRCIICRKDFKSKQQLANHENSKKHKDKVKTDRKNLMKEEMNAN